MRITRKDILVSSGVLMALLAITTIYLLENNRVQQGLKLQMPDLIKHSMVANPKAPILVKLKSLIQIIDHR